MIEGFYNLLAMFGFHHPIHPILVHIPMGMVVGAVLFSLADKFWPGKNLDNTAYHCIVLALVFVVPVYIAGLLDWQQWFGGDSSILVTIKLILGVVLAAILVFAVQQKRSGASQQRMLVIYLVSLAVCGGLGYSGGELVWGG